MFGINTATYDNLIVFLGNPGDKYENTRHNAGFIIGDYIATKLGVTIEKEKFLSKTVATTINGQKCLLIKPQTFMNLSGDAILAASNYYKIPIEKVIVVQDEVALNVGIFRIKIGGSCAGHNGIRDILEKVEDKFIRIRVGVGEKPSKEYDIINWVLGKFPKEDREKIDDISPDILNAIELIVCGNISKAMSLYNKTNTKKV
ncbi:MAG: aminoacyl-tRNA hydrolase [Clostridia bacterium]